MRVTFRKGAPHEASADTLCVGLFEDEALPEALDAALSGRLGRLVESGEAKPSFKRTTLVHANGAGTLSRVLVIGLGKRADFDGERARVAAAVGYARAKDASAKSLAWAVPEGVDQDAIAAALTEGTVLASYRFDRFKTSKNDDDADAGPQSLEIGCEKDVAGAVESAALVAEAQNSARELQNLPANELTPSRLADHAVRLAAEIDSLEVELLGPERIAELGMGGLQAVSKGSHEEACLIVMRYAGGGARKLAFVGKAVTFDTGGISIKPSSKMEEMKMDMSGGSAAIEATAAIARLGLSADLVCIVPATENMPSGHAVKPGDVITTYNGKTVEVNNTDAEGRLILADALAYAVASGAERLIDLATLTGAIITALGSTYAGLFSNDDALAGEIVRAGEMSGEVAWRMPLHADYKELTRGKVADLTNVSDQRKAASAYAASFLEEFVDGRPWAHLDIAGTAWGQDNRDYVGKGASGWGVRMLVELVRAEAG